MTLKKRFTDDSYRKEPWFRALVSALVTCKTDEDMMNLLRDVGTLSELQEWSERLEVARLLAQGISYREVSRRTGASTTTVTRVAKYMENGAGGYRKVLNVHRHHRLLPRPEEKEKPRSPAPASPLQKYLERSKDSNS